MKRAYATLLAACLAACGNSPVLGGADASLGDAAAVDTPSPDVVTARDVVTVTDNGGGTSTPDVVSPGEDVVSSAQDVVISLPDAGKGAGNDAGGGVFINPNATSGCGCSTPRRASPSTALFVGLFGLAALRRRRRR